MKYWRDQGTPVEKLMMGFATYGRTFRTVSADNGVGARTSGPASAGPYTREAGFWSYYEVRERGQSSKLQIQFSLVERSPNSTNVELINMICFGTRRL